jgi:hypothetical protein
MDTSERSLGKEGRLLITVRMASVEGVAVHPARVGTEVPRGKLPAKSPEARIDVYAGLFEAPLQFFDDFVQTFSHDGLPSTRKQAHAQTQGSFEWKPEIERKAASRRWSSSSRSSGRERSCRSMDCGSSIGHAPVGPTVGARVTSTSGWTDVCAGKPDAEGRVRKTAFECLHLKALLHRFDSDEHILHGLRQCLMLLVHPRSLTAHT